MPEEAIREQLRQWRQAHPQATFDEIDAEVARAYAQLHAEVVGELSAAGVGEADRPTCPECQVPLQRRGPRTRQVLTRRGVASAVVRDYYVCPACGAGLFPPR